MLVSLIMRFGRLSVSVSVIGVIVLVALLVWSSIKPRNDRDWKVEHSVLPHAAFEGDGVTIRGIRNFSYQSAHEFTPAYYDREFDLSTIESLWFILSIFRPDRRGPAHSFLSFGFANGDFVSVSVEARQEKGESYSVYRGLFKKFEIIYVIGDERDLVGTRAVQRDDYVYLYPIRASRDKIRALFEEILVAANQLHESPEFYSTLSNNCTTRIHDHVNRIVSPKIPGGWKILLPGYADEIAYDLGLIDTELALEAAREQFWINDKATRYMGSPDFSQRIRQPID